MHNLEDMIERYRRELMEFSEQNSLHTAPRAVPAAAEVSEPAAVQDVFESRESSENLNTVPVMAEVSRPAPKMENGFAGREPYTNYENFLQRNPAKGALRVQVFASGGSFPISNADVRVTVDLADGETQVFSGRTDENGILDNIELPAPDSSRSFDENSVVAPYTLFNIYVKYPGYAQAEYRNVPIFDSVKSIQPVELVPLTESGKEPGTTIYDGRPSELFGGAR